MANVGRRCEVSRQPTPGALYWAAGEPSDPRARAVYWQLLNVWKHEVGCVQLRQMARRRRQSDTWEEERHR